MKISFNWVKKYLDETDITPEELVEKLKSHLSDVESVEDLSKKYESLLIGEIIEKKIMKMQILLECIKLKSATKKQYR